MTGPGSAFGIIAVAFLFTLPIFVVIWIELDQCQEETGRECVIRAVPVEFDQ